MNRLKTLCISIALAVFAATPSKLTGATITVFAAASLADSLKEIIAIHEKSTGDKIVLNLAASSVLARQIEEGAPADLFFSADEAKMDGLEKKGLILKETRVSRLSNSLVIVVAAEKGPPVAGPKDLAKETVKRIALAEPRTVPAGIYAKAYLEKIGLLGELESKIVPTENVRAALAAVEAGNAEAGIVYKTDAAISRKVRIAFEAPSSDTPAISYPVAVVKEAKEPEGAKRFVKRIQSEEAGATFTKFGFIVLK